MNDINSSVSGERVADQLDNRLKEIIAVGDVDEFIIVLQERPLSPVLVTIGCRLAVRRLWIELEKNIRLLDRTYTHENDESIEAAIRTVIESLDSGIKSIKDDFLDSDIVANTANSRALKEFLRLSPQSALRLIAILQDKDVREVHLPGGIIEWAMGWRDTFVQDLWGVVQDYRENGIVDQAFTSLQAVNATIIANLYRLERGSVLQD